jgi:hypothetical protein
MAGGTTFASDREAAERLVKMSPDLPLISQANRAALRGSCGSL